MAAIGSSGAAGDEKEVHFRQVLTSARENVRVETWEVASRDVDPRSPVPWSAKKRVLHGGLQEGVDLIEVDNGKLRFTVVTTRGMGILRVEMGDVRLGWDSPIREVVNPAYIDLHDRNGLGWIEGFNEWLARCGLEWAGGPGKDEFVNNAGDRAQMDLTLHGRIANLPASEVIVEVTATTPRRIRVLGRVDERTFFGPKLELWAEVSTEVGSGAIRIHDAIANRGASDQEFQIIYHTNFGRPLLGEGARFVAPVERVMPFTPRATEEIDRWTEYAGPTPGYIEHVFCVVPHADGAKRSRIMLVNGAGDRAASMEFSTAELPFVTLWKNTAAVEDGYVTGLEPATGFPNLRKVERMAGRVPVLKPGETRQFQIDVAIHAGVPDVEKALAVVEKIRNGRPTRVDRQPVDFSAPIKADGPF